MAHWLADDLESSLASIPGSPEREHVLTLLRGARRLRLGDEVTRAAADTVRFACDTVERNLDTLTLRAQATWIEYDHAPRAEACAGLDGAPSHGHAPERVGCLVACNPESPANVAVFVAWRFASGAIHHSYALLHWDRNVFFRLAAAAPARPDGAAADRLLEAAQTTVPPGLLAELEIWQGYTAANHPWRDLALLQTQRDATGEHLFLLSALLLVESSGVVLERAVEPAPGGAAQSPANDNPAVSAPPTASGAGAAPAPAEADDAVDGAVAEDAAPPHDHWQVRLAAPARRWPWQRPGFRLPMLAGALVWTSPIPSTE